jgi:UDP-3-O-[3-hydroxymyristoyl] glucosamine N-acyltransferase
LNIDKDILTRSVPIKELIASINEQHLVLGNTNGHVRSAYPIDHADKDSLSFCRLSGPRALEMIINSKASVILCSDNLEIPELCYRDKTLIQVANPRLTFSRLLAKYFLNRPKPGIHPSAIIEEKAKISDKVYIGPQCYIGDCEIGESTIIEGRVFINSGTKIGKNVIIHPGVVIGTAAVSFERNEVEELEWFPQLGGVVIEENVEIGANTHIARGPLPRNDTVIGEGSKLDVMVEIGHGVRIGKHCLIVGLTTICGRVTIGDYTVISAMACIRQGISVGSRALVGMGSMVLKDVPNNTVVFGTPAKPIRKNHT